jgi:hypothetical protein
VVDEPRGVPKNFGSRNLAVTTYMTTECVIHSPGIVTNSDSRDV